MHDQVPRCDGVINDIIVQALGIHVVFELGVGGEDSFEEPSEEFEIHHH